jgi:hypothetical protein
MEEQNLFFLRVLCMYANLIQVRISVDNTSTNSTESAPNCCQGAGAEEAGGREASSGGPSSWKPSSFDARRTAKIALRLNGMTKKSKKL